MRSTGLPEGGSNHRVKAAEASIRERPEPHPEPSRGKERGAPVGRRMVEGKEGDGEIESEDNCSNVDKRRVEKRGVRKGRRIFISMGTILGEGICFGKERS